MNPTIPRIVLDTNVCLDLFVFQDPRWQALRNALENKQIDAVTREDCRNEWLHVLDYPHLPVTPEIKEKVIAEFDRLIRCIPVEECNTFGLPVCSDKDDQKFLETSLQIQASVLITKDKALLKLAKKTKKRGMFDILQPQAWAPTIG